MKKKKPAKCGCPCNLTQLTAETVTPKLSQTSTMEVAEGKIDAGVYIMLEEEFWHGEMF
jgi:hypothetical protein